MEHTEVDVLIAGAGPTGMVLALWLAQQGVKVAIVDQAADPGTTSRAMVVQARTLELYRQLRLADDVVLAGKRNLAINLWVKGKRKAHLALQAAGASITRYPFVLVYPQDQHEALLSAHLVQAGVQVRRPLALHDFTQHEHAVEVRLRDTDGMLRSATTRYLVGCDGARSLVRHRLGADFTGGTYAHVFYVADVDVEGVAANGEIHVALAHGDFVLLLPYGDTGRARLIGAVREQAAASAPLHYDDISTQALTSLGIQVRQVHWFSTYRVHHRIASRLRADRVFLAGDAAHVHSPVGGQGMNTGIADAVNLAWKLAAVVQGEAPDTLLDSYASERMAVARRLVDSTDRLFSFVTAGGEVANFLRLHVAPILASAAYQFGPLRERLFRVVSQTGIDYRNSPLSAAGQGQLHAGDRLPWVGPGELDNHVPLGRPDWQVQVTGHGSAALHAWCSQQHLILRSLAFGDAHVRAGFMRDTLYLVRPDGYLALAAPDLGPSILAAYFRQRGWHRFASVGT